MRLKIWPQAQNFGHTAKLVMLMMMAVLIIPILGCSDNDGKPKEKPKQPWVMELHVVPTKITISANKFYPKPFTVRAKYSNAVVKNVSKTIKWVSENINLLDLNEKGELITTGECREEKCSVFLVGTDPDSGKSVRVTVNIKSKKKA